MFLEIFGPTLKDLKIKTNSSYEDLAGAVSARSIGLFAGCVVGGVLVDRFGPFCHLFLALALDMAAAVTVAAPWSPGINVLTFCCAIGGVSETIINVGKRSKLNLNMHVQLALKSKNLAQGYMYKTSLFFHSQLSKRFQLLLKTKNLIYKDFSSCFQPFRYCIYHPIKC